MIRRTRLVAVLAAVCLVWAVAAGALETHTWTDQVDFDLGTYADTISSATDVTLETFGAGVPDASIPWWDTTWLHRRCFDVTNGNSSALTEPQVVLQFDTAVSIGASRMNADGSDLRFISSDGSTQLDYWIESGINSTSTTVWVQLDAAPVGTSTICGYFGNAAATAVSDPIAPFTYSTPQPLYALVSEAFAGVNIDLVAYADGTTVDYDVDGFPGAGGLSGAPLSLDAGDTATLAGGALGFTQETIIYSTGPLALRANRNGGDSLVPLAWGGTQFVMPSTRGGQEFSVMALEDGLTIDLFDGTVNTDSVTLNRGETANTVEDIPGSTTAIAEASGLFLITHQDPAGTNWQDTHVGVPASTEPIYGVRARRAITGFGTDGTTASMAFSDGSTTFDAASPPSAALAGDRGDGILDNDAGGLDGAANAEAAIFEVTAGGGIGSIQQADRDGGESVTFWPESELNVIYYLPSAGQFSVFACSSQGVGNLAVNGTAVNCGGSGGAGFPGKFHTNTAADVAIGSVYTSPTDEPFWMFAEPTNNDEYNVLGPKQARLLPAVPLTYVDAGETSQYRPTGTWTSELFDTSGTPFYRTIDWNLVTQPAGTTVVFQSSSASSGGFVGPDGTAATFYTALDDLADVHDGDQFIQIQATLTTTDPLVTPVLEDVTITYDLPVDVSGTVFSDLDADGTLGAEPGLDGVDVLLYRDDGDGLFDAGLDTLEGTVPAAGGGLFAFSGLEPGTFFVLADTATVPVDHDPTATSPNPAGPIVLMSAESGVAEIGFQPYATLDGLVFGDVTNEDGLLDVGETGVEGVSVNLWLDDGDGLFDAGLDALVDTALTDVDGLYSFTDVVGATYHVEAVSPPAPFLDATTANPHTIVLAPGDSATAPDIGLRASVAVDGTVFEDVSGEGVFDGGEPGLAGVTVNLYRDDGDGLFDAGVDVLEATTVTAVDGTYLFEHPLPGGTFWVEVDEATLPAGSITPSTTGNPLSTPQLISLESATVDLGYQRSAVIDLTVFRDDDLDGIQGVGELGIEGVTVELLDAGDVVVATAVTDANGVAIFADLDPGSYTGRVDETTLPSDVIAATTTTNPTDPVVVGSSGSAMAMAVGYPTASQIVVTVFEDLGTDGVQSPGEPGIPGVSVTITGDAGTTFTGITDANGVTFGGLAPDTYTVTVDEATLPEDVIAEAPSVAPGDVVLAGGQTVEVAFGYAPLESEIDDEVLDTGDDEDLPATGASPGPTATLALTLIIMGTFLLTMVSMTRKRIVTFQIPQDL